MRVSKGPAEGAALSGLLWRVAAYSARGVKDRSPPGQEPDCLQYAAVPLLCQAFAEVGNVHARSESIHETLRH